MNHVPTELLSEEKRRERATAIILKYPNSVPIFIKGTGGSYTKYIVPYHITISGIIGVLRNRIKISEAQAIYLTVNNKILAGSQTIGEVHNKEQSPDGFLYLTYCYENVFG